MTLLIVLHVGRSALGDLASEVEHDDLVGDAHHQLHVVLDEQHGQAELIAKAANGLTELVDLGVGQPRRWFVEQQQSWLGRHRPGELDPLERAERQAGRRAQRHGGETEVAEDVHRLLGEALLLAARRRSGTAPMRS